MHEGPHVPRSAEVCGEFLVVEIGTNLEAGACSNRNFGWYILGGIDADFSADGFF